MHRILIDDISPVTTSNTKLIFWKYGTYYGVVGDSPKTLFHIQNPLGFLEGNSFVDHFFMNHKGSALIKRSVSR